MVPKASCSDFQSDLAGGGVEGDELARGLIDLCHRRQLARSLVGVPLVFLAIGRSIRKTRPEPMAMALLRIECWRRIARGACR